MGGMGFSYGGPGAPQQDAGAAQSATIELQVSLPDSMPPRAGEFLKEVVKNLGDSLYQAYGAYVMDLRQWWDDARSQRRATEAALGDAADDSPAGGHVRAQLRTIVDLSALNRQMPLTEAVEVLRKAVAPPLNIVVLWTDVKYQSSIEPTTPINIDGMPKVRLGTALDLLVKGLMRGVNLMWRIKDDTVVIGTAATLGRSQEAAGQPKVEADTVNLAGQRSELTRKMQALELDLAGVDARREAIGAQILNIRKQVDERLSQDAVIQELEKLTQVYARATRAPDGHIATPDSSEGQENMIRARIQVANRREELSKQAGGGQLEEFNKELSRMAIDKAEKEAQLQIVRKQLDEVQKQIAQMLTFDPEAARLRMVQEALDIAARRVADLQMRIANLQPPMVTMIGAN
jgi:hypothetical protein